MQKYAFFLFFLFSWTVVFVGFQFPAVAEPGKTPPAGPAHAEPTAEVSPGSPAETAQIQDASGVFGYFEVPGGQTRYHHVVWPKWQRILEQEQKEPFFTADGKIFNAVDGQIWRNLVKAAGKKNDSGKMRMVNAFFNHWRPRSDEQTWADPDYWSSPAEFASLRGGDCEDYAVAKYFALRFLGVAADNMRIVVLRPKDAGGDVSPDLHAVLAVKTSDTWFILDNNARPRNTIIPHTWRKGHFVPVFSVNEHGSWGYKAEP